MNLRPQSVGNALELIVLGLAFSLISIAGAQSNQTIGKDIRACQPSWFEFVLDFSLTCQSTNIVQSPAIATANCMIGPLSSPATDLVPVEVQSIDVLELDQDLNILVQTIIPGRLMLPMPQIRRILSI